MITNDKTRIGVVVECYDHDLHHCIVTTRFGEAPNYTFFYLLKSPLIDFGDIIQMNFAKNKFSVCWGNSKLTYKITPLVFPGTLLYELISERMTS